MRSLLLLPLLMLSLLFSSSLLFHFSPSLSAATVSGEITNTVTKSQYATGARGECYTFIKNKKNGRLVKRIVAKKYCKKINTTK